ncbi:hypothetical protein HDE_11895 [Halotydeus destructor]|nr:hypothetical protein HDE_11895 [Halotydeus destructor]
MNSFKLPFLALLAAVYVLNVLGSTTDGTVDETTTGSPGDALKATLVAVAESSATFEVSGPSDVLGHPVKSIKANYYSGSKHLRNRTEAPVVTVESYDSRLLSVNEFSQTIKIDNLEAGRLYHFSFEAVNDIGQVGPPSKDVAAYLLPAAPDVEVQHPQDTKIIISWSTQIIGHEDYFVVSYELASNPGCNVTLSISTCFGMSYSFDDLQRHQVYRFTIQAHNPSGFSKPAIIDYPID